MKKFDFGKSFAAGFRGLSRFIIEFSTEQKSFTKNIRFSLAHTARNLYPKKSIGELAHMTGLLRSQITDALDDDCPVPTLDKEAIILSYLWKHKNEKNLIPINGSEKNSFNHIASEHLKGKYSISAVMQSLIDSGAIKKQGENLVILSNTFAPNKNEEALVNLAGLSINRFINTVIHNKNSEKHDKIYQQGYKTTKVAPSDRPRLNHDMRLVLENIAMPEIIKVIEKYERDVPNGHYPEYGVSIFEFDETKNNQGKNNE